MLFVITGCGESSSNSGGGGAGGVAPGAGTAGTTPVGAGTSNLGGASAMGGGGAGPGGGTTATGGMGGMGGIPTCPMTQGFQVARVATTAVAMLGKPFDTDGDKTNPWNWETNYGKSPEIAALPDGENLDVLFQDHSADPARNQMDPAKNAKKAFVLRLEKGGSGYAVTRAYSVDQLAHIMGFAKDENGNYFVATGVDEDEDLTPDNPGPGMHRSGIAKLIKFDVNGCKLLEVDVDDERAKADPESEPVINPMTAATSRLAYHAGRLALVHGINVDYDPKVMARHQKAMTTHLDAMTGAATLTSSMWVSHSFDQRLFWDGTGFVELHLGDAYPRAIAMGRFNDGKDGTDSYELFREKGDLGDNNTFTRLGGIAPIAAGDLGYLVVFTTERGTETADLLNGTRDLAFLRVSRDFSKLDSDGSAFVDGSAMQMVTSSGKAVTNKLTWLTDYAGEMAQADRPRVAAIGGDQFVVLWERWTGTGDRAATYGGLWGLVLGGDGMIKVMPKQLGMQHLSRGDDVVTLGSQALFVSGSAASKKLVLNLVSAELTLTSVDIP